MRGFLLGIDIGTSGAKCVVIDDRGHTAAEAAVEYTPLSDTAGYSEQDPEVWYGAVRSMLRLLSKESGDIIQKVIAVGVTGQMRGLTFIGHEGRAIRDSILWNDLRCEDEVRTIKEGDHGGLTAITKNPLNTMCSLPKIVWVMNQEPRTWEKTHTLLFPKDYITYRLTGNLQTDHSDASGSSLYDMKGQTWSDEILDRYGIEREKLPDIVSSSAVVGTLTPRAADETGIPAGVPVVAGGSDAATELFAAGIIDSSQCKVRLGTSGALSTITDDIENIGEQNSYVWAYIEPNRWMLDINTRSCAQSTVWLRDMLYNDGGKREGAFARMEHEAAPIPVGADGLLFHPYLMGEDAPYWDPKLKGSFWGITASHTRGHFIRAVYEGTAFALADALGSLGDIGRGFADFVVVGGGTKNRLWTRIVLDVLGIDGNIPAHASASFGAALLAGVGAGVFGGTQQAAEACRREDRIEKHSPDNHAVYSGIFERYKRMKEIFDEIYKT
jgi:xylulokinase